MENQRKTGQVPISARLQRCADFVRPGKRVADVGTDHGYLSIALLQNNRVPFVTAADINVGPLDSARRNAVKFGVQDRMQFICTDGLQEIQPEDAQDIVIAGMGGELILRIITQASWLKTPEKHLVLQPMTAASQLRCGLYALGFSIEKEETLLDEKRVYSVLSAYYTGKTCTSLSPIFTYMGKIQPNTPYSAAYAQRVLHNLENKIKGAVHRGDNVEALCAAKSEIESLYLS